MAARLAAIRERIATACRAAGRPPESVTLVAVSKMQSAAAVAAAIAAGQMVFGENRLQEADAKFAALRAQEPGLRLHLIGALQTNKAGAAVRLANVIESLDRPRLADAIARAAEAAKLLPELLVQVNVGAEPQKAGVMPAAADAFIEACRARFGGAVRGLMCIPPEAGDPAPHFDFLTQLARRHGLAELSMGMSGDFELAVRHGATQVRIGGAIFGVRAAALASQQGQA